MSPEAGARPSSRDEILAHLPDLVLRVDASGVLLACWGDRSDLALAADAPVGGPLCEALPAGAAGPLLAAAARARREGRRVSAVFPLELGGAQRWYEANVRAAPDGDALVGIREITELHREAARRRELEAALELADRMRSLGTLAAGIAHEINNPLAALIANLEHVHEALAGAGLDRRAAGPDGDGGADDLARTVDDCREGADRIRRIVRGLRAFAMSRPPHRGPVPLAGAIGTALALAASEVRHRARVVRADEGAPVVMGDEAGVVQVLVNLLVNAGHAIPADAPQDAHEIRVTAVRAGEEAVVTVSDTGVGIDPAHLGRVFDPFFTTKPPGEGTGLGLSLCQAIVHSHGGSIVLDSAPGRGTRATVRLPAIAPGAAGAPAPAPAAGARPGGRVLVVDDEPAVLAALGRALAGRHEVVLAGSGEEALARLASGERFDAVICDLVMPGTSGMDLHDALRARHPELLPRLAFVTGGAFTPAARAFLERPGVVVLEKPFESGALCALVDRLVAAGGRGGGDGRAA